MVEVLPHRGCKKENLNSYLNHLPIEKIPTNNDISRIIKAKLLFNKIPVLDIHSKCIYFCKFFLFYIKLQT